MTTKSTTKKTDPKKVDPKKNGADQNGTNTNQSISTMTDTKGNGHHPLPLQPVDMTGGNLPDLADAKEFPLDLMSDYWTPEKEGETKRLFFDSIRNRNVLDQQNGDIIELPCAFFYEKIGDDLKTISNGSKRLVGIFETGAIQRGTPLQIKYLGKKKTRNGFQADIWSVKPLLINL